MKPNSYVYLKSYFEEYYTKKKLARQSVASPFIHKDFARPDYKGNMYKVL